MHLIGIEINDIASVPYPHWQALTVLDLRPHIYFASSTEIDNVHLDLR